MNTVGFHLHHTLFVALVLAGPITAGGYLWPTDASKHLTSSFCEFRPRHFHAAIDIKTWNRTGYNIFAVDDGYIYRIRVSANGYGKALYVKLKDGNIAVYAHLERFIPSLETFANELRKKRRRYVLDYFPDPNQFPVKKGEVLGYTGETGIGVPHLHFEIRDPQNRPMNPLRFYPGEVEDTIPPRVRFLAVIPRDVDTFINFRPDTLLLSLPSGKTMMLDSPIYLTGSAYIAVSAYDMGNGVHNKFGIYQAELRVNGTRIFEVRYDYFSYANTHLVELDKNFSLWRKGLGKFQNLFRHPQNDLPVYPKTPPGGGILDHRVLNAGENELEIRLSDFQQNETVIRGRLIYHRQSTVAMAARSVIRKTLLLALKSPEPLNWIEVREYRSGNPETVSAQYILDDVQHIGDDFFYYLSIPLKTNPEIPGLRIIPYYAPDLPGLPLFLKPLEDDPMEEARKDPVPGTMPKWIFRGGEVGIRLPLPLFSRMQESEVFAGLPMYFLEDEVLITLRLADYFRISQLPLDEHPYLVAELQQWHPVIPGTVKKLRSSDGFMALQFQKESLYDTLFCRIQKRMPHAFQEVAPPYRRLSEVYDVRPVDQPMNRGAEVIFYLPDSLTRVQGLGAYYWDARKGWLFLPTRWDREGNRLRARITSLEQFVLIQDTVPPAFRVLSRMNPDSSLFATRPLYFEVEDEMAGIYRERQITVRADGDWTIFEYDPEEKFIRIDPQHLPKNARVLEIIVEDNVGNRRIHRFPLRYN